MGLALAGISLLVRELPVIMSVITAINAGLMVACSDALRKSRVSGNRARQSWSGFEVGAVAVITASALVGTQSMLEHHTELLLSTMLLVLTTGYAAFYLGLLANQPGAKHSEGQSEEA